MCVKSFGLRTRTYWIVTWGEDKKRCILNGWGKKNDRNDFFFPRRKRFTGYHAHGGARWRRVYGLRPVAHRVRACRARAPAGSFVNNDDGGGGGGGNSDSRQLWPAIQAAGRSPVPPSTPSACSRSNARTHAPTHAHTHHRTHARTPPEPCSAGNRPP